MIIPVSELIASAKSHCNCMDQVAAKLYFDRNEDAIIIDVREPKDAEEDKLTDSINIPRGLLEMNITDICDSPDTPILVYCDTGDRASLSVYSLQIMGYSNVHVIDASFDGIKAVFG